MLNLTSRGEDDRRFVLSDFLRENNALLELLGVFGAISIYLSSFSTSGENTAQLLNIGIIASLILFLLCSYSLLDIIKEEMGRLIVSFLTFNLDRSEFELFLFLAPFLSLTIAVSSIVILRYSPTTALFASLLGLSLGWLTFGKAGDYLTAYLGDDVDINDFHSGILKREVKYAIYDFFQPTSPILSTLVILMIIGIIYKMFGYPLVFDFIPKLVDFVRTNPVASLFVSFFIGIGSGMTILGSRVSLVLVSFFRRNYLPESVVLSELIAISFGVVFLLFYVLIFDSQPNWGLFFWVIGAMIIGRIAYRLSDAFLESNYVRNYISFFLTWSVMFFKFSLDKGLIYTAKYIMYFLLGFIGIHFLVISILKLIFTVEFD